MDIIGQFGVGFYSAFMVSDKVTVDTRAFGSEEAWHWESEGLSGYEITPGDKEGHGTAITLHLKPDAEEESYSEFLDEFRFRGLVKRYSDYIRYPIQMEVTHTQPRRAPASTARPGVREPHPRRPSQHDPPTLR